ncbi:MAG: carboxypeptidase-like regulatory domain-containing protein [Flavobacteriaceae bacterium]
MKQFIATFCLSLMGVFSIFSQEATVKGKVVDANSSEAILGVEIRILNSVFNSETDNEGLFSITNNNLPQGEQVLIVNKADYVLQRIPITIQNGKTVDLGLILLQLDLSEVEAQIGVISLSDNELNDDEGTSYNVSGLLQASNDTFLDAASFDFSATFFRPRGLDSEYGKVLINGIEMNKQFNGRPQWSNWGGLNDAQRNREFSMGLKANDYTFGDLAGTTNMIMRASQYRKGGRVSYALANRSYTGRVMGSYNSGFTQNGWAYSVLASRRFAEEGYQDGTLYDANSFFASVEKKLNDAHSLNLTAFYTPNRRGRSTAITQEARDLKGIKYNPNWGYQDGEKRNSRERNIEEPVIMLNHFWTINEKTRLNTNIGYQFGKIGDSRIDNGGNRNPFGNYYQRMPSYFLRFPSPTAYDYQLAYLAEQEFINDGQIDWNNLYQANLNSSTGYSSYVLQEDRVDDTQLTLNTILSTEVNENITLNGTLNYRNLKSDNFATITDLLGGTGYQDFDRFFEGDDDTNFNQSDAQNPDRIVQEGDIYKYHYELNANVLSGFAQAQFKYSDIDFYLGANVTNTSYQRTGIFQNGYFQEGNRSLGDSEKLSFTNFGVKGGLTYKVTGRHLIDLNGGYFTKAPTLRNSFANARQNNDVIDNLTEEKVQSADLSYIYRSPIVKARATAYYAGFQDATEINFFFTQDTRSGANSDAFVQEILQGIEKRNMGVEMGIEAQVTPTFLVKAAASVGQNLYTNNPTVYLAGDDFDYDPDGVQDYFVEGNDLSVKGKREVFLENYHVAGGPERACQIGFEYRDPDFWWVGATTNYFSNAYVDISSLRRSEDFTLDSDGQPFANYDPEVARQMLQQEQLDDYFLVNIVGGKSWKIKDYYVGFFATINNVLNQEYKTGGFEDSRRSKYDLQLAEQQSSGGPIFGNRYFFGNGTTYYVNLYVRF